MILIELTLRELWRIERDFQMPKGKVGVMDSISIRRVEDTMVILGPSDDREFGG